MMSQSTPLLVLVLVASCAGGKSHGDPDAGGTSGSDANLSAADASSGGDATVGPCGNLSEQGVCVGDTLRYCDEGEIQEFDCSTAFPSPAVAHCHEVNPTFGAECMLEPGSDCQFETSDGPRVFLCAGQDPGCVFDLLGSATCREDVGVCSDATIGSCGPEGLVASCYDLLEPGQGQPVVLACDEGGGECEPNACVDLIAPAECFGDPALSIAATCASGFVCAANGACRELDGPVVHYPLDGNAIDLQGGPTGTMSGVGAATDRFGTVDGALAFLTTSNNVSMASNPSLPSGSEPRTVSVWLQTSSTISGYQALLNWGVSSSGQRFGLTVIASGPFFTGQYADVKPTMTVDVRDGQWHHLAATYDGTEIRLWLDGAIIGVGTPSLTTANRELLLGKKIGSSEFYEGHLDDLRVYDYALSNAELDAIYRENGWPLP